jgi:hypothetical protein
MQYINLTELRADFERGRGGNGRGGRGPKRRPGQDQQIQQTSPTRAGDRGRTKDKKCSSRECVLVWNPPETNISSQLQKEKEELDDLTMELELADEDDPVPYVTTPRD